MTDAVVHRIERVDPRPGYKVLVTWTTGEQTSVDFSEDVKGSGVWAELRDERKFAQVRAAYGGTVLEWPEPSGMDGAPRLDVDADGLYSLALQQRATPWIERILHSLFDRSRSA